MCTAIIYRDILTKTFGLGFNRDESFLRKPSHLPTIYQSNSTTVLAPKDGDHGGTWIGVNAIGEVYAILNYYEAKIRSIEKPISRGLLVNDLLERKKIISELTPESLHSYHPFRLLSIDLEKTILLSWDGEKTIKQENNLIYKVYASSAIIGSKAETLRETTFQENFLNLGQGDFFFQASSFLNCHIPEKGIQSPCMHRDIAHTVSQTIIQVESNRAKMWYKDGQPCEQEAYNFYEIEHESSK